MNYCYIQHGSSKFGYIGATHVRLDAFKIPYRTIIFCLMSGAYVATAEANQQIEKHPQAVVTTANLSEKSSLQQEVVPTSQLRVVQLQTIVVKAEAQPGLDAISQQALTRFAPISAGDLLKGQASVQLGDSRNGGALDVNIRGVQGQNRVAVTVDGAQQSLEVYRGYSGSQNRSYIDPLLISSIEIEKGPSAKAGGAIGGTVAMQSLGVQDILRDGKNAGVRLTGTLGNNGRKPVRQPTQNDPNIALKVETSKHQGDLSSAQSRSGSIAAAWQNEKIDFVAAYAERVQGNYFAGQQGRDRYRLFDQNGKEQDSVAKIYAAGEEVLNSSSNTQSLLLKSVVRPADAHRIQLSYMNFRSQFGDVMPSDIIRSSLANLNQYPLSSNRINHFASQYQYRPAQNDWIDLDMSLWMNHAKTNQLSASFFSPTSQLFRKDRAWSPQQNNRYGLELSNKIKLNNRWGDFVLTLGGAAQYERLKPQSTVLISQNDQHENKMMRDAERKQYHLSMKLDYHPTDALHLWSGLNFSQNQIRDHNRSARPIRENREVRQIEVNDEKSAHSGYMYWFPDKNGEYTAATDPRLNNGLVFKDSNNPLKGVSFSALSQDATTTAYDPERLDLITGFKLTQQPEQKFDGIAPHFGVDYKISDTTHLYSQYTAQNRLPSLFETSLGTHQVMPGQQLKPETAQNWEVGMQFDDQQGLMAKLNYFNNKIDHFITRYYDPSKMGLMTFSNMDHFKSSGIELQSKYDQGDFFAEVSATRYLKIESCDAAFAKHLRETASSYQKTENTPNCTHGGFMGSYLNAQNPPRFSTNLTLGTRLLDQRLVLGGRYTYSAAAMNTLNKPWQTGATTPQMKYQSVGIIDLFADYKINQHAALNFSLQNLANRYYLDPLALSYMPAPGRTISLGFKLFL